MRSRFLPGSGASLKKLRHLLQYGGYRGLQGCLRVAPYAWARPAWRLAGRGVARLARGLGRLVDSNLELALPELPEAERRRLRRECFAEIGALAFDAISAGRFPPEALERRVAVEGWHHVEEAERLGHGVFLMGAHFAAFEVGVEQRREGELVLLEEPARPAFVHRGGPRPIKPDTGFRQGGDLAWRVGQAARPQAEEIGRAHV